MFTLGSKEVVINDIENALTLVQSDNVTAATTAANTSAVKIAGFGTFTKANISLPIMMRAKAKAVKIATITAGTNIVLGTISEAVRVLVRMTAKSLRNEAAYFKVSPYYGNTWSFDFPLPASANANQATVNLYKAMKAYADLYSDLPFTIAIDSTDPAAADNRVITLTGKTGLEHVEWVFDTYAPTTVKTVDDNSDFIGAFTTLSMTQTQAASIGRGLGSWIEQNVSMYTPDAVRLTAEKRDQLPVISDKYLTVHFTHSFTSESVAAPGFVGEVSQSGKTDHVLYINENGKSDADLAILVEALLGVSGVLCTKADDSAPTGADNAAKAANFLA